jgi:chitin synthase
MDTDMVDFEQNIRERDESSFLFQDVEDKVFAQRLNLIHCVKFNPRQKLNSHLWFFQGFCKVLNPLYCYMLDAGVEPQESSLRLFFKAFEFDHNLAGVCGYLSIRNDRIYDDFG